MDFTITTKVKTDPNVYFWYYSFYLSAGIAQEHPFFAFLASSDVACCNRLDGSYAPSQFNAPEICGFRHTGRNMEAEHQKKVFTNWVNSKVGSRGLHVEDLFEDLK